MVPGRHRCPLVPLGVVTLSSAGSSPLPSPPWPPRSRTDVLRHVRCRVAGGPRRPWPSGSSAWTPSRCPTASTTSWRRALLAVGLRWPSSPCSSPPARSSTAASPPPRGAGPQGCRAPRPRYRAPTRHRDPRLLRTPRRQALVLPPRLARRLRRLRRRVPRLARPHRPGQRAHPRVERLPPLRRPARLGGGDHRRFRGVASHLPGRRDAPRLHRRRGPRRPPDLVLVVRRQNEGAAPGLHRGCSATAIASSSSTPPPSDRTSPASIVDLMARKRRGETERGFSMCLGRVFDPRDTRLLQTVAFGPDDDPVAMCQFVPAPGHRRPLARPDAPRSRRAPQRPHRLRALLPPSSTSETGASGASA